MKLVYAMAPTAIGGLPVVKGDTLTSFRGEKFVIEGWREPQHPASQGHVWGAFVSSPDFTQEVYPSVFDLKFV